MSNPYLDDLTEQQRTLLESSGLTPEDYAKDPSLAGGVPSTGGAGVDFGLPELSPDAPEDSPGVEEPDARQQGDPSADPHADLRTQAIRSLMAQKYPERAGDKGGLFSARGMGKAQQAFYSAGGGKNLKADFFAPEDTSGEAVKKAQYEIQRANALSGLLGKRAGAAGAGTEKSSGLIREVVRTDLQKADPVWYAKNKAFVDSADVDELAKVATQIRSVNSLTERKSQNDISNEHFEQQFEEKKRKAFEDESFRSMKHDYMVSEDGAAHLSKYSADIKDHAVTLSSLEQIEKLAPGLPRGIVTPDVEISLSSWNKIGQDPRLKGFWNKISPDEHTRRAAILDSRIKNLSMSWLKSVSGAAVTDQEFIRMDAVLKSAVGQPPEVQAAAIDMLRQLTARRINLSWAANAGTVRADDVARFRSSGGIVGGEGLLAKDAPAPAASPDPAEARIQAITGGGRPTIGPGPAAQPTAIGAGKYVSPEGDVYDLDDTEAKEAAANGWKRAQ